jgi:metallo-beta-lactamase family protein
MTMELEFLGGAGTVTGSKTLVHGGGAPVLVDCGLFQGFKHLRERNWGAFAFDPSGLGAVVLTHAHLDHSGLVPRLVAQGYEGPVFASAGTIALCRVLWPDSGRIQEEDAGYANRKGFSKHHPARPLYTEDDAVRALASLVPVELGRSTAIADGVRVELAGGGHILGASLVRVETDEGAVLFSGDLGRPTDLLMLPPSTSLSAPTLVLESTYGDRHHPGVDPSAALAEVVRRTVARGGTVLVPAFAIGRAQSLLLALERLQREGEIPRVRVFLDSPMAAAATEAHVRFADELRLTDEERAALSSFPKVLATVEESKSLNRQHAPCVIISAAGMLTGGRVLHHLTRLGPDPRNTLLLVGYQAPGTRGAAILSGASRVKAFGSYVPVRCEVEFLDGLSAHADQQELVDWVAHLDPLPRSVLLNHGEPTSADVLRHRLVEELGVDARVVTEGERVDVSEVVAPRPRRAVGEVADAGGERLEAILRSPSYVRADRDLALIAGDELRGTRLMLEFLKVDNALSAAGIERLLPVFGSARTPDPDALDGEASAWSRYYAEARALGRLASQETYDGVERAVVVTGGGPGIMEAANRGAFDVGARTAGFNITLEHEQVPNSYVTPELAFQFRYFAMRKMHFLLRAVGLVAFPGGFGTADEVYETLTLVQTDKMSPIPVVLVGRGYWESFLPLDWLAEERFIDTADARLPRIVETGQEAWREIQAFHGERGGLPARGPLHEAR